MAEFSAEIVRIEQGLGREIDRDPQDDEKIETLSVLLIAHIVREIEPRVRYMVLDWSDQGPHHEAVDFTGDDGVSYDTERQMRDGESVGGNTVHLLSTNLRGVVKSIYRDANERQGTATVDLRAILP